MSIFYAASPQVQRVQKIQKIQKVQRVQRGRYRRFAAMNIKTALRDCLPALIVILTPGEESCYM